MCDQKEIRSQIQQILKNGIIELSFSPFSSPVTLVTKRDKIKRFCIDYRKVNELISSDVYPLPRIEDILDRLAQDKHFSTGDIYWQVHIHPDSRPLLAFYTLEGFYRPTRLPFGLKTSPHIYERAMSQILQSQRLDCVAHYFDDFVIFFETLEEHRNHLRLFFAFCEAEKLQLNFAKCEFYRRPSISWDTASLPQKELNQLLKENQALFSQHETDIGRIAVQHKIHTIEHPPISCRPYRRPLAEYDEIKRQVEELSKKGLIRESQSPWAFPVVLVSKKDGSQRMCIDYRKLNAITIDDKQPLPYILDMFDRLHNAKYFTTLDIAWGYWHVEIHPDSVEKTAFITNDGHYEFLVMPFGLKNAPSTFQRINQHIIGNLLWNGVCNYQDDILIYSSTFKDHIELMKKIFDKLKENNIKLKLKKCSFAKQEIRYLGHIIGHNKIKPDPEKTKAINEFPQPKTVKQVRQFLGLAGYYRKFIPKFSEIADPLTSLTRKNNLFKWTTEVNKSFQELKSHLSTDPVLSTYDPSLPWKLLPHQQNYSAFELECFAVVQSVEYFEVYLENNTFEVITDHSAMEWLFNPRITCHHARCHELEDALAEKDALILALRSHVIILDM
ncbi:hypothetical protein LAZ67_7002937 [Cordylochernes scorpioides]|uniref:Reverse transcriptase domain-containing protein n=1 Tax=Cordylochernes scorpioides TaxID=51811 RepID=A0ABY6KNH1_9ARAC|nr:hypothetical protein LAZ67_7002937 [Cordylochernes scorpioides]